MIIARPFLTLFIFCLCSNAARLYVSYYIAALLALILYDYEILGWLLSAFSFYRTPINTDSGGQSIPF